MTRFDPDCLFCDIAQGRTRAHVVAETRQLVAFADHAPIRPGHIQIIPRAHHRCFEDIPAPQASQIIRLGQRLSRALKAEFGVERVGFLFTGHGTDHAHAHLVPLHDKLDITSLRYVQDRAIEIAPCPAASPAELADVARRVAARLEDCRV